MNILRPLKVLCGLLCGFAGALHAAPLSASIPMLAEAPLAGDCSPTEVGRVARAEMEARLNAYLQLSEEALSMRFQAIKLYAELVLPQLFFLHLIFQVVLVLNEELVVV